MAMPLPNTGWTLEMVHALPDDGKRYELVDGELLVSAAPIVVHQRIQRLLGDLLSPYLRQTRLCELFYAPYALTFSQQRELQPDLLVVRVGASATDTPDFGESGSVLLAVEILSPSTARHDRWTKRKVYQEQGVTEYWIVDPDARLVERWLPNDTKPELHRDLIRWPSVPSLMPLEINLLRLFAEGHSEWGDGGHGE